MSNKLFWPFRSARGKDCNAPRHCDRRPTRWHQSLRLETLERRDLLAVDTVGFTPAFDSWWNPMKPLDVNADQRVSALDALIVINALNNGGARALSPPSAVNVNALAAASSDEPGGYVDVNGDGRVSALDALMIINDLNAAAPEMVRIRLVPTDTAGNPITSTVVGADFQIRGFVQDIRETPQGVFQAYVDVTYSSALVSVDGSILFGPDYGNGQGGNTSTPGLVDEVGALDGLTPLGPSERLLFVVPYQANVLGTATFTLDPADVAGHDVLVFGSNTPVPPSEVEFVNALLDIEAPPSLSIDDVSVTEGNAGTVNATFTVSLSATSGTAVTVNFQTANGTATQPADYQSISGMLTFNPGQTTRQIVVAVQGDMLDESDETFLVNLSGAVGAAIADNQGVGTILDDDVAPSLSINNVQVQETNAPGVTAVFTVSLSAPSGRTVTVNASTGGGTATGGDDYTAIVNQVVTFAPGQTTQTINIPIVGDFLPESTENFFVTLSQPSNATINDGEGEGTILDNDVASDVSINDIVVAEPSAGQTNALFTVSLSAPANVVVTVNFTTVNGTATAGSDYQAVTSSVTFQPGQVTRTISVPILSDSEQEPNETFFVNLTGATSANIVDNQGQGTILDAADATARIRLQATDLAGNPISSVGLGQDFQIRGFVQDLRDNAQGVFQAFADIFYSSPLVAVDGPITFGPDYPNGQSANTSTSGLIDEIGALDGLTPLGPAERLFFIIPFQANSNGTATFNLDPADAAGHDTLVFGSNQPVPPEDIEFINASITIDPVGTLSINDVSVIEGNTGTVNAVFTVTLSSPSTSTVTVNFETADGTANQPSDYQFVSGTLTFDPGVTTRTITVPVNGDMTNEPNETFFVNLSGPQNATITDGQGLGTIISDDLPINITINDITVAEPNAGQTNAQFTVTLSSPSSSPVTVNFTTANGTATAGQDYTATTSSVTFQPGQTTRVISIPVLADGLTEGSETFFVNLTGTNTGTITDNQGVGTIVDPLAALVKIRLETTDLNGTPDDTFAAGDEFILRAFVQDLRPDPQGVFQAYFDILYSGALVQLIGPIEFGPSYPNGQSGNTSQPGVIDEGGAFDGLTPLGGGEVLLFSARFRALGGGTNIFSGNPADVLPTHQILLFGDNTPVPASAIQFVNESISISGPSVPGTSGLSKRLFLASRLHDEPVVIFTAADDDGLVDPSDEPSDADAKAALDAAFASLR